MRASSVGALVVTGLAVVGGSLAFAQDRGGDVSRLSLPTRFAGAAVGDWVEYRVTFEERIGRGRPTKKSRTEVWVVEAVGESVVFRKHAKNRLIQFARADTVSALTLIHYFSLNGDSAFVGVTDAAALASRSFAGPTSLPEHFEATGQVRKGVFTADIKQFGRSGERSLTARHSDDLPGLGLSEWTSEYRSQIGEPDARGAIPMAVDTARYVHLRHGTAADPRPEPSAEDAGD
jgi:hypothetical protein